LSYLVRFGLNYPLPVAARSAASVYLAAFCVWYEYDVLAFGKARPDWITTKPVFINVRRAFWDSLLHLRTLVVC
jgi:hypothetical protein